MTKKPPKTFKILHSSDIEAIACLEKRLDSLATTQFGSQTLSDIVFGSKIATGIPTMLERVVQETQHHIGAMTDVLGIHEAYQEWQWNVDQLMDICSGVDKSPITFREFSDHVSQTLNSLNKLMDRCRNAAEDQVACANLKSDMHAISGILKDSILSGWLPLWNAIESKIEVILESGASSVSAEREMAFFVDLWATSEIIGRVLVERYNADVDWPVHSIKDETLSSWLLVTIRNVSQWGEHQLARMLKLRPGELPPMPLDFDHCLTAPVAQMAFEIEVGLSPLRAKVMGAVEVLECIKKLRNQSITEGFVVRPELHEQFILLLSECVFDPEFLTALKDCSAILGPDIDKVCRDTLIQILQTTPLYLQIPQFATQSDSLDGYHILSRVVSHEDVNLGYALRVWVKQSNWNTRISFGPSDSFWLRLQEFGAPGWWIITAILDKIALKKADLEDSLDAYLGDSGRSAEKLLPLALMQNVDITNESILSLLAAIELLAFRTGCELIARAIPIFMQRFAARFPVLCANMQVRISSQVVLASTEDNASLSEAHGIQEIREQAYRSLRPRKYNGIKIIEQLSRRFIDEKAAPLLMALERANHADEINDLIKKIETDLDVGHLIDQWGRNLLHGPEGRLRQQLIDDCKEMVDSVLAIGRKLLNSPNFPNLESLADEISKVRIIGGSARYAADLMELILLSGDLPKLIFPGEPPIGKVTSGQFPRTLRLWNIGNLNLETYLSAFEMDLGEDVLDYAISEAEAGRVGWAEQLLDMLDVPKTNSKRLAVEERGQEWAELIELDRQEIMSEMEENNESENVKETISDLNAALMCHNYLDAVELLEKMRPLALACQKAKEVIKIERDNMSRQIDNFLLNVSRAKLPLTVRSEWTKRILTLQDELANEANLTLLQEKLRDMQSRIAAGEEPPPLLDSIDGLTSSMKEIEQIYRASGELKQQDPRGYSGIVKALVGTMYGFIVPFDARLREKEDIYFHKNNFSSMKDGPELPPLGSIVGFSEVIIETKQPRPSVQNVWILSPDEKKDSLELLSHQLGIALDTVGYVSENTFFTIGYGFHAGPFINFEHRNAFARLQLDGNGCAKPEFLISDSSGELTKLGTDFFHRLTNRASTPKKPSVLEISQDIKTTLLTLHPSRPDSYRDAKVLQSSIENSNFHERVVSAMDHFEKLYADRSQVAWLRAVLVGSYLVIAKTRHKPLQSILDELTNTIPDWFGPNQEGTFILVYQALLQFSENNPKELSYEQMWSFFNGIQKSLGSRPHYRLELIQAYMTIDEADREGRETVKSNLLRQAENHIKRSMVIHPRITEPHDLLRQIEARHGKRRFQDELPGSNFDDPIFTTRNIRNFYDVLGGRVDERKATEFYNRQKASIPKGLALDELIGRHCRYLLTSDSAVEAERLLLTEARYGNIENWSMVIDLLHDVWIEQNLGVTRIKQEIKQLRDTLPAEVEPHLELLLGRVLFEKGHYDSALRHADQAQVLRSTEARQLMARCRQLVQRGLEKRSTNLDLNEARKEAWSEAQQIAAEGDGAALSEYVLSHMDDSNVGPWLTLMCVSEKGLLAHDAERRSLVLRSRSLDKSPSLELLKADIRVRWNELISQQIDRLDPALLNKAVKELSALPEDSSVLDDIEQSLSDVVSSFAFYDALLQIYPSNLTVRWRLAVFAKKRWINEKNPKLTEEYIQAALPCVGFSDTGIVSPAVIANDFLSMKCYGLSAIVAYFGLQRGKQALADLLRIAEEKAIPAPWEWPTVLQRSRVELDEGSWGVAVNSLVCALLANPCHWPSCRAYLKAFSDPPGGEDPMMLKAALGMALWGVQLVGRTEYGKQSPELLVLQAELVLAVATLEDNQVVSDKAMECSDLCTQAQRLRQGFKQAITLQNRLKPDVSLAPGETFAKRYRIVEALPPGSYGQVYRAEVIGPEPGEATTVALKLVRADASTPEKRQQQRSALEREARIARQLKHPGIVRVHDFIDGRCLVMEYVDGKTLSSWIDSVIFMPWQKALQIGIQVAVALEYASEVARRDFGSEDTRAGVRGFAHRDIHPGNIMVINSPDGYQAKLLDFGLARVPGGTATTAVFAGVNRRMVYRAPEYGTRSLDHRGDMFALGIILYQLITGEDPYPCDLYCDFQITQDVANVSGTLRRLDQLAPQDTSIPSALADVLARMVAFRFSDRPADWTSVIRDLREFTSRISGV